jgi:ATP-binding cassette subfamily A (ABC1) protein 3
MAGSDLSKLKALMKKNLVILKRNVFSTIAEIVFPILLMIIILIVRKAFGIKKHYFDEDEINDDKFTENRAVAYENFELSKVIPPTVDNPYPSYEKWYGQPSSIGKIFGICYNNNQEPRFKIATINVPQEIKDKLVSVAAISDSFYNMTNDYFKDFDSTDKMKDYVSDNAYGSTDYPKLCFGISFPKRDKDTHEYEYLLHYFADYNEEGIQDLPMVENDVYDEFRNGPNTDNYEKWYKSGFVYMQKIISEWILENELDNGIKPQFNFVLRPMKYELYREDLFGRFVGYIVPFFVIVAYMCPLCLYVLRMVGEKETKAKEGMKIMGMNESIYFLSYFIQYFIINFFQSFVNALIIKFIFEHIPYILIVLVFFLWGMCVFSLIFFFQSFIDRTRVALILSLLIYFVMAFVSMAVFNQKVKKIIKIITSIFPPVGIFLGVVEFGKFESNFKNLEYKNVPTIYLNYSVLWMYIMFIIDFFFYLFLGFYLQNVISHEFGISRPFYFLCTKSYWCGDEKKNKKLKEEEIINNENNNNISTDNKKINDKNDKLNFQSEDLYKDKTKKNDVMKIRNIIKTFDDGKTAVNGVNLNIYKDEIFALLGHNGAGKTTLINMLCGMYDATGGSVFYDGENILGSIEMDNFRTKLGICPQHDVLFEDLTIREHLSMFATFKGVDGDNLDREVDITIKDFQLGEMQNIIAKDLSAGQRRKLSIAISLVGGSEVIFLDEPSSGMDITSRRGLWEILKRITEKRIIILTTHYMEEASVLGNRIGIMHLGELKCLGTPLFLIERFGKFMSLRLTKEENADNKKIIKYIQDRTKDVEFEVLNEEIMFRIPKSNYSHSNKNEASTDLLLNDNSKNEKSNRDTEPILKLSKFFEELDGNLKELNIKSYSASMPTLEDVFLNVAADDDTKLNKEHRQFSQVNVNNDKILFETDFNEDYSNKSKFCNDFKTCMKKRWLMTIRDIKGVFLEILVPILLICVGLIVCQVKFDFSSTPYEIKLGKIGNQIVYYGSVENVENEKIEFFKNIEEGTENVTTSFLKSEEIPNSFEEGITKYSNTLYNKNDDKSLGSLYILNLDNNNHVYEFAIYINTIVAQGPSFFSTYFLDQMINYALQSKNINVKIKVSCDFMPLTAERKTHADQSINSTMVFFVAVAFTLIPANFITVIVKERINNSKHLMRVSGINMFAYWLVNYIFELSKYLVTGAVCTFLIYVADFYPKYFVWYYLLYGPPMIGFTYCFSFLFDNEATAQNATILLNYLIGALGSAITLMFKGMENLNYVGDILIFTFGLLPSFDLAYGYDFLLNYILVWVIDSDNWFSWSKKKLISIRYGGTQLVYLAVMTFVYIFLLYYIEYKTVTFSVPPNEAIQTDINDENVQSEIKRVKNLANKIEVNDETNTSKNKDEKYALIIENLNKKYPKKEEGCSDCCRSNKEAIKNLNLAIEYGECFGLLGINGAGKTTTFKCITQEHAATNGKIYINGVDISKRFSEISHMFGYCPQFDAIFEFMTVYENLEFYALIKGVKRDLLDKMINAMIDEMSLDEFTNKIAGRLSGGNKRKLSVAISMICNPPIVLLDEPSTGMDPEARRFMWAVIHKVSSRRKKSAVIMTTHSMDEAETLCKRMGIMVNGEFVCLGSANEIKNTYGYGFEVDIRIKPLTKEESNEILTKNKLEKNYKVNLNNINSILEKLGKPKYIDELKKGRLGEKLLKEISINNEININQLISWIHFISNAIKLIKNAKTYFEEIILTEYIDNNFLFKIKKSDNSKSIGFLFGLFEEGKDDCYITEYSIQQTSLEQIFNKFAANQVKDGIDDTIEIKKLEIPITEDVINNLLN